MGEAKTGIKPMVEIECRGEPCVRPRTKTSIEPMVENIYKSFAFGHRFDTGFCSRANTRFAPTFIFGHRLKKLQELLCPPSIGYAQQIHDIIIKGGGFDQCFGQDIINFN
jgi:hypothetical protein